MSTKDDAVECRVKFFRQTTGLSQSQLAERVGIKRQAIYDIESGRYLPNTAVALKMAKHLGCRVEDLFMERRDDPSFELAMAERLTSSSGRVSVAKIRGRWIAYPVEGMNAFDHGFRPSDGVLNRDGGMEWLGSSDSVDNTVFLLGCDPAFTLLSDYVSRMVPAYRVNCRFASSLKAMEALSAGQAHLAGVHLHRVSETDANVEIARKKLAGIGGLVINYARIEEGLLVRPGNPHGIRSVADLVNDDICIVNREPGAALRLLLDDELQQAGIPGMSVQGYHREVRNHTEGALSVAHGFADATAGFRAMADAFGLDFVPLAEVRCDLVIPADMAEHPVIQLILETLQSKSLRSELEHLSGYNPIQTGSTIERLR